MAANDKQKELVRSLVNEILNLTATAGIDWPDACMALGISAKSLAIAANSCGCGKVDDCIALMLSRVNSGLCSDVDVIDSSAGRLFSVH